MGDYAAFVIRGGRDDIFKALGILRQNVRHVDDGLMPAGILIGWDKAYHPEGIYQHIESLMSKLCVDIFVINEDSHASVCDFKNSYIAQERVT